MSASWMSAICVPHMQMATFGMVRMRIVSFAAVFRFVMQHSSLCNAPPHGEGHCVMTLKMAVKETMMRRICLEIKKFIHNMLKLNIQDCCKSEWGSDKSGKGGWNILLSLSNDWSLRSHKSAPNTCSFCLLRSMIWWSGTPFQLFFKTSRLKRLSSLGASVHLSKNWTTDINHYRTCQFMLCSEG